MYVCTNVDGLDVHVLMCTFVLVYMGPYNNNLSMKGLPC